MPFRRNTSYRARSGVDSVGYWKYVYAEYIIECYILLEKNELNTPFNIEGNIILCIMCGKK